MVFLTRLLASLSIVVAGVFAQNGLAPGQQVVDEGNGQKSVPLRTHSLYPPYLDSDLQSRWWEFGGDTVVDANKQVRLTYDRASQVGWIFSRLPLTATNFEIVFEFKIHGKGTGIYGDGMALWITKQRAQTGTVFGFTDNFEGLGVFIDTYKNGRAGLTFPYVMAMLGDGRTPYDNDNDGKANDIGGCSARGIRKANIPTKGRLTYRKDDMLSLELQYKNEGEWSPCFNIPNITLPTVSYLGFSAHTGEVSDFHDLLSVETKTIYSSTPPNIRPAPPVNEQFAPKKGKGRSQAAVKARKGDSFGMALLRVVGVLVIMGVGYFIWTAYRAQQTSRY